jgi:hypothetical protein
VGGEAKGGIGGHIVATASKHPKRFAPLLEMAPQLKRASGGEAFLSDAQAVARIKKMSLDEIVMEYLIFVDEPPSPPSSTTDFLDAIIAAATRHGSNGRGKNGVEGYIRMLAHIGCKTFDRWVIRAMVEQVKGRSPKSTEEIEARLRERGVDVEAAYDLAFTIKFGRPPPERERSSLATELEDLRSQLPFKSSPDSNAVKDLGTFIEALEIIFDHFSTKGLGRMDGFSQAINQFISNWTKLTGEANVSYEDERCSPVGSLDLGGDA